MTEVKLCKDCKHINRGFLGLNSLEFSKCKKSRMTEEEIDFLETGKVTKKIKYEYCDLYRKYGKCGPEGKHWEAKE
jgi:hypothetical protein